LRERTSVAPPSPTSPPRAWRVGRARDAAALGLFVLFFLSIFGWAIFSGEYLLGGDAFFYMHPLRASAWRIVRAGHAPIWTPHIFSGFPLLAQTQLGLGYPLAWLYLVLPSHLAEQIYVYAPFVLAPAFLYLYAREIGRSRTAAIFAGLTFAYGGYMTNVLGMIGMTSNPVAWLPLFLVAIERARTRPFARCLVGATVVYAMAVLNGYGQNFLYVGIIAAAYGLFISLFDSSSHKETNARREESDAPCAETSAALNATSRDEISRAERFRVASWRRWRPFAVACGAILFAAGLAAFQILETLRAQRRSIRSAPGYQFFVEYSFTPATAIKSLAAPLYNFFETTPHVTPLALLLAIVAVATALRSQKRRGEMKMREDSLGLRVSASPRLRVLFWSALAVLAFTLMLGDATPLNRLLFRVPVLNLFRRPSRHAFEWTFSVAILAAYGWDEINDFAAARLARARKRYGSRALVISLLLIIATACVGAAWSASAHAHAYVGAGVPAAEAIYLRWKLAFTLGTLASICAALGVASKSRRGALVACCIVIASFVEPYILVSMWWRGTVKTAARLTTPARATRFLQQFTPAENRVYVRANSDTEETSNDPRFDALDVAANYDLQLVTGYEPLLLERVSRAFGDINVDGLTPREDADANLSLFAPRSRVLDLLNATHVVAFPDLRVRENDPPPSNLARVVGQSGLDAARWQRVADFDGVVVLRNSRACPRAWLVGAAEPVDGEEALRRIRGEPSLDGVARDFNPLRSALLEDAPAEMPQLPGGEIAPDASARVASYEPSRIVVETDAPQASLLVVSEIFYPGWVANVDGAPARIHLTDYLLRGVAVPAGRHRVEMRYVAPAARNGAIVSTLTLCCLVALAWRARRSMSVKG
jgi:hypothetical protein